MMCPKCYKYKKEEEFEIIILEETIISSLCETCTQELIKKHSPEDWGVVSFDEGVLTIRAKHI